MAEKEYIERGALIAEYDRVHVGAPGGARKLMVDAPAADVVEVVHGKWKVTVIEQTDSVFRTGAPHCSLCGKQSHLRYQYCPNCGAKMDGGAE